jgi:hypothetical protein
MRHILAFSVVLVLAGVCLGAEFKSDEARKAQADYLTALEAAKNTYGQGLAKAKAVIDAKAAAATDAISKEAIQSESAAVTEELVRLRDADAAAFEPREWKSAETKKVRAAHAAELKPAQTKYGQNLTRVRQTVLARKTAATDSAAKEALQAEIALIEEEQARLKDDGKGAKKEVKQGAWIDLLKLIDVSQHVVLGACEKTDEGVHLKGDWRRLVVPPVVTYGNYDVEAVFVNKNSDGRFCLLLPIKNTAVDLWVGSGNKNQGADYGLEMVNGKENTKIMPEKLVNDKPYTLLVQVRTIGDIVSITSSLDGKPFIQWSGPANAISLKSHWKGLPPNRLGLGAYCMNAYIKKAQIQLLTGNAGPSR